MRERRRGTKRKEQERQGRRESGAEEGKRRSEQDRRDEEKMRKKREKRRRLVIQANHSVGTKLRSINQRHLLTQQVSTPCLDLWVSHSVCHAVYALLPA